MHHNSYLRNPRNLRLKNLVFVFASFVSHAFGLASFCSISASAQVPLQFNYQGRLTDTNGVPVVGVSTGIFNIYKGGTVMGGGTNVFSETWTNLQTDVNGVFSAAIGSVSNMPLTALADSTTSNRLIEVVINGQTNLPRQQMLSVPYAIASESGNPPGAIIAYGGVTPPAGWLLCDGSIVSRATYPRLFTAISTNFGWGNNNGTDFSLPDFRGNFLRGVSGATTSDPDRFARTFSNAGGNAGNAVGSFQGQATRKNGLQIIDALHQHTDGWHSLGASLAAGPIDYKLHSANGTPDVTGQSLSGASLDNGDNETRPRNVYVNYIIKY